VSEQDKSRPGWLLKSAVLISTFFLGMIAMRPYIKPDLKVSGNSGAFDYLYIISPMYLYKGDQGILILDKRNGNVWFVAKGDDLKLSFRDPVYVTRLPFEKLDQAPD